ncbi:MAG: hypothetical protein RL693_1847, partial [Verrucomicrobiota bacterium]
LATIKIGGLDSIIDSLPQDYIQWESDSATTFEIKNKKREVKFAWNTPSDPWGKHWIKLKLGGTDYKIFFDVPDVGPFVEEDMPRIVGPQISWAVFINKDEVRNKVLAYTNEDGGCRSDAIKHATWSASMAQAYGNDIAQTVTNAHEGTNKMGKDFAFNSTMDQHNNAIGRAEFITFRTANPGQTLTIDQWIQRVDDNHYMTGNLWIWRPKTKESNNSEGILRRSNYEKIK